MKRRRGSVWLMRSKQIWRHCPTTIDSGPDTWHLSAPPLPAENDSLAGSEFTERGAASKSSDQRPEELCYRMDRSVTPAKGIKRTGADRRHRASASCPSRSLLLRRQVICLTTHNDERMPRVCGGHSGSAMITAPSREAAANGLRTGLRLQGRRGFRLVSCELG